MPTAHKQEHLRVIHGLVSMAAATTNNMSNNNNGYDGNKNNSSKNGEFSLHQHQHHSSAAPTENYFSSLRNSTDARTAKIAKKMQMLNEHADIFPASNLSDRPIMKSSTLSKMVITSMNNNNNNNNMNNNSYVAVNREEPSNGKEKPRRSLSPAPSVNIPHQERQSSTTRSTTPAPTGFNFRSNEHFLNQASSSNRMKLLLEGEYDSIPKMREAPTQQRQHQAETADSAHQCYYQESRNPIVMRNYEQARRSKSGDDNDTRIYNNNANQNNGFLQSSSLSSSSTTKPKFDFKAQQTLAVVENVVRNIMTKSPARESYNNNQNSFSSSSSSPSSLKLLSEAANYQASKTSRLNPYIEAKAQNAVTSLRMMMNNDLNACPDCGKVILSLDKHQCEAESTTCPKCGVIVSLLSFDRHFLNCAVGAGWATIREKKEMERLMLQNAASFRKSRSSVGFGIGREGSRGSGVFGLVVEDSAEDNDDDEDDKDTQDIGGKKNTLSTLKRVTSSVTTSRQKHSRTMESMRKVPTFLAASKSKNADLRLSVDEGVFAHEQPAKSSMDLFREARQQGKLTSSGDDRKQKPSNSHFTGGGGGGGQDSDSSLTCPPGYRACVLCRELIKESQLPAHLETCNQNLLSCPLCKQGVPAHAVDDHKVVCEANRRRCPFCSTSIQFARLPDHVSQCCESHGATGNGKMTMYHGTSEKSAKQIIQDGFLPSQSGLLGEGVYMTRDVTKAKSYGPVIIEALVTIPGKILTVSKIGHRLQKTWQIGNTGYDAAWIPQGVSKSGLEEHCIKNPQHIAIVKVIRS